MRQDNNMNGQEIISMEEYLQKRKMIREMEERREEYSAFWFRNHLLSYDPPGVERV